VRPGRQEARHPAALVGIDGNVPGTFAVLQEVAIILVAGDSGQLRFERGDGMHVVRGGLADQVVPFRAVRESFGRHHQKHILIDRLRYEARSSVQGERVQIQRAGNQSQRFLFAIGIVDDVL